MALISGDRVDVYRSAGEPRVSIYVEDGAPDPFEAATAWLTPVEARAFAARIIDVADSIDHVEED